MAEAEARAANPYVPYLLKSKRRVFDRFAVLFVVAIVWAYAEILTAAGAYNNTSPNTQFSCRTDRSGLITAAPWLRFPYLFQWGRPTFDIGDAFAMIAASLVALVESIGTFITASRYSSATIPPPFVLSRGVGWQGIGTLLAGMYGTGTGLAASMYLINGNILFTFLQMSSHNFVCLKTLKMS